MKIIICVISFVALPLAVQAQIRINDPTKVVQRRVESGINSRVNKEVNGGIKKAEDKVTSKPAKKTSTSSTPSAEPATRPTTESRPASDRTATTTAGNSAGYVPGTGATGPYSQFDFVPATTITLAEDFKHTKLGDFPAGWNTNSTGEVVTIRNIPGQWLALSKQGQYMPEAITELPENFTLQFNLACSTQLTAASTAFSTAFVAMKKPAKEFAQWTYGRTEGGHGVSFTLHPYDTNGQNGNSELHVITPRDERLTNKVAVQSFMTKGRNLVRVSVSRQQERLRVYINDEKIWDVPHAFQPKVDYSSIVFALGETHQPNEFYYLSNLQLAVGAPDTRTQLLDKGKFVTRGIHFKANSDQVKPDSNGALRDIAAVLNENRTIRVLIVDHTNTESSDAANMALSKRRAEAVRAVLASQFGVDASRLSTDGKGETQPAVRADSPEGQANNRRVEFIRQ
ncbi:OmpA family protein [Fibrella sp. WM1]|uniref:OmpA family protein n=1 Tax=Fibrella musci TaxID=3242485 RepID=UPI0035222AC3